MPRRKKRFTINDFKSLFAEYSNTLNDYHDEWYTTEKDLNKEMMERFFSWLKLRHSKGAVHFINAEEYHLSFCNRNTEGLTYTTYENLVTCKQCLKQIKELKYGR